VVDGDGRVVGKMSATDAVAALATDGD